MPSTDSSVGISIMGCDSTRAPPRCLSVIYKILVLILDFLPDLMYGSKGICMVDVSAV